MDRGGYVKDKDMNHFRNKVASQFRGEYGDKSLESAEFSEYYSNRLQNEELSPTDYSLKEFGEFIVDEKEKEIGNLSEKERLKDFETKYAKVSQKGFHGQIQREKNKVAQQKFLRQEEKEKTARLNEQNKIKELERKNAQNLYEIERNKAETRKLQNISMQKMDYSNYNALFNEFFNWGRRNIPDFYTYQERMRAEEALRDLIRRELLAKNERLVLYDKIKKLIRPGFYSDVYMSKVTKPIRRKSKKKKKSKKKLKKKLKKKSKKKLKKKSKKKLKKKSKKKPKKKSKKKPKKKLNK